MALVRVKQNFQITLPVEVRNALSIAQGDLLEASVLDNAIVLTPKAIVDRTVDPREHTQKGKLVEGLG